jgi:hypothetical protein
LDLPAGQSVHAVELVPDWKVPTAQLAQLEDADAPVVVKYFPEEHPVQLVEAVDEA